ncbi:tyrosine-type recombinase/integrase [Priestia megaterium]|uniref:tyrosine-type recombinase/integrase n=1 Tax=Priestia megaterium TaxID=1404 RepID=UPI000E22A333|nr:tyrosine-type recombinase/integrase [Priestia megaterium]MDH3170135.1 tyrosine-type recombinase/integrase [Priestia megaterium]
MCAKRIRKGAKVNQINLKEAKEKIIKIKTLEGMAQSTLNQYNLVFNDLITFFENNKQVSDITLNDARDFINWLLHEKSDTSSRFKQVARKGVKPSSVNNYLQKTRAAFNILKREGVLSENLFNEIRNVKFQKHKVETLSVEEIKRIFNAFNKSYYAQFRSYVLLHTLLDTLGRVDKTLHLKKQDVDFDKRSVTFQNTKSKKFRIVPISRKTARLLQELIVDSDDLFNSEYIFLTNDGKRLCPSTFRAHLEKILKNVGINKRIHPHLWRHTGSEMFLRQLIYVYSNSY